MSEKKFDTEEGRQDYIEILRKARIIEAEEEAQKVKEKKRKK